MPEPIPMSSMAFEQQEEDEQGVQASPLQGILSNQRALTIIIAITAVVLVFILVATSVMQQRRDKEAQNAAPQGQRVPIEREG